MARDLARGDLSRRVRARHGDELGELGQVLDTLADELQRRMGQLEGERAEMLALIDAMSEGVLALGPDGRVRRANLAARRIFGLAGEPGGLAPHEVARRPAFLRLVERARAGEQVSATELSFDARHLLATAQPLAQGGAVLVFLDVTELRRLEDVRRDFVANASHELKTPLTAIRGYSETLLDENLPPELRRRFAEVVKENADRLQRIVDDLLDLSRIESGGWRAEPEEVAVAEAAEEAWAVLEAAAADRGVGFEVRVAPGCGHVRADPSALRQVFTNLLDNALRHTPGGGEVSVSAGCAAAGGRARARAAGCASRSPTPAAASPPCTSPASSSASTAWTTPAPAATAAPAWASPSSATWWRATAARWRPRASWGGGPPSASPSPRPESPGPRYTIVTPSLLPRGASGRQFAAVRDAAVSAS